MKPPPGRSRLIEETAVPTNIKLTLSLIVALVGLGAYLLETKLGDPTIGIIAGIIITTNVHLSLIHI